MKFDVIVIGGGIVGMSTAWQILKKHPKIRLGLLETESRPAAHQTGNNSGVIHSGLYYRPGSLKARNCVRGRELLYAFCRTHNLPHDRCGKLVVATSKDEIPRLLELYNRGVENGLKDIRVVPGEALTEYEPAVQGVQGLFIRETGIVDYSAVTLKLADLVRENGGEIHLDTRFIGVKETGTQLHLETTRGAFATRTLVNCAGLHSDRVARLCGVYPGLKIMPFRGEYYKLKPERSDLVKNLIYPVPDPQFPFLGVHFTRMINGDREAGPNAVLAFQREGYSKSDINFNDIMDYAMYGGFWRMGMKHWRMGLEEFHRSFSKSAFVKALQRLIPSIESKDVEPAGSGVRAQALEPDGFLADDFRIVRNASMVHVLNAPSPAATAGLSIGGIIADIALATAA